MPKPESSKDIYTHQIHNFTRKILQRSIFDKLKSYVDWRIKLKKGKPVAIPPIQPISINLDLTTGCNYYCDHCIDLEMINKGGKLKLETIKQLISRWVKRGLRSVIIIGGGEPTLYSHFEEVVIFLKAKKLQVGIASNGSRLPSLVRVVPFLSEHDWVRLSLDAGKNDTFQKIHNPRIRLNLDEILKNVQKLRSVNSKYQLGFSFLALSKDQVGNNKNLINNISEIFLAAKKAKESGFTYFSIKPFISPCPSRFTEIHKIYLEKIKKEIARAKSLEDKTFKIAESFNMLALINNLNEKLRKQPKICHAQFFRLVVTPKGIFHCPAWRGFTKAYLIDAKRKVTQMYYKELRNKLHERLENFNATQECSKVSCIYNDFNWFIEGLIRDPDKLANLQTMADYEDYFL